MDRARAVLSSARRVFLLTGAGMSTEAGIPDFRSPGGIWSRLDPETFSLASCRRYPAGYWRLRGDLLRELDLPSRTPTAAHRAVAEFAATGRLLGVATQNIDGLHERAGLPERLLARLHGSAEEVTCLACGRRAPYSEARDDVEAGRLPPACRACGGVLKPGTVLFGEEMPEEPLRRAFAWASTCDVCVVAGSSLSVHPAATIPERALARGARLVVVNRDATSLDDEADAVVREPLALSLPSILR